MFKVVDVMQRKLDLSRKLIRTNYYTYSKFDDNDGILKEQTYSNKRSRFTNLSFFPKTSEV